MGYYWAMILSRKKVSLMAGLLSFALAGLMVVQGVLLRNAWDLKNRAFDRNVRSALALTIQQIEAEEIAGHANDYFFNVAGGDSGLATIHRFNIDTGAAGFHTRTDLRIEAVPMTLAADSVFVLGSGDSTYCVATVGDSLVRRELSAAEFYGERAVGGEGRKVALVLEAERSQFIERVVGGLVHIRAPAIDERLAAVSIDSILTAQLTATGIDAEPRFAIVGAAESAPVVAGTGLEPDEIAASPYRARLYPLDLAPPFYELVLHFPGATAFVLKQVGPLLLASVLFLAVIVFSYAHTVRALLEQRRFAGQVVDFVNNMTHEFKTPISTVSLASEAIAGSEAALDSPALLRYNGMIREETDRMTRQVEKILQIAQLERGDFRLNRIPLDGHQLIEDAVTGFSLQVDQHEGSLVCELGATRTRIMGDEVHLSNILGNLLDNAVKYSLRPPEITVASENDDKVLIITVSDRGLGVSRTNRERVFDPYFRCPTGNRHDVKGFGLGLSYVRLLTEAHGGNVMLRDNPGGGTRVRLALPLANGAEYPEVAG